MEYIKRQIGLSLFFKRLKEVTLNPEFATIYFSKKSLYKLISSGEARWNAIKPIAEWKPEVMI